LLDDWVNIWQSLFLNRYSPDDNSEASSMAGILEYWAVVA
jgi:hypothetical protein